MLLSPHVKRFSVSRMRYLVVYTHIFNYRNIWHRERTHSLLPTYSNSAHQTLSPCSPNPHSLLAKQLPPCSPHANSLLNRRSLPAQHIFTFFSPHAHSLLTTRSLPAHQTLTPCSTHIHFFLTTRSLPAHHTLTPCSLLPADCLLTMLQGKVEAELILMTAEEAEKNPAGLGREDPNG